IEVEEAKLGQVSDAQHAAIVGREHEAAVASRLEIAAGIALRVFPDRGIHFAGASEGIEDYYITPDNFQDATSNLNLRTECSPIIVCLPRPLLVEGHQTTVTLIALRPSPLFDEPSS
ncbi:hypothetical protein OY671_012113, partial [Metschnikowia pulcherrima]